MKTLRIGTCGAIAFAVLAHGAVEGWSEAIFEIWAATLLAFWAWRMVREPERTLRWNMLNWPLFGLPVYGLAQLSLGWSMYPFLTKQELLRWAAYCIFFFLAAQAFRTKRDFRALVWFLVIFGFLVGLFGIVQHFTFNGKLYWVRTLHGGIPFGPFVNRNHFAGFMEMVIPFGIALLITRGVRKDLIYLTALFTVVQAGALVLSASRGGIASFAFGCGLLVIILWMKRAGTIRLRAAVLLLLATVTLIAWLGVGEVAERFERVGPEEVSLMRRGVMMRGAWHIFRDHPWTGTGAGTLVSVYPKYEGLYDGKVVDHAHDDYVEALSDLGVPGGLLAGCFLVMLFGGALRALQEKQSPFSLAMHAGAAAGCGSLLIHSFVDFNLHIPSNATLFLILAFLATSPALPSTEGQKMRSYPTHIIDTVGSLGHS